MPAPVKRKPVPSGSPAYWRKNAPINLMSSNLNTMGRLRRAERWARHERKPVDAQALRRSKGAPAKRKWLQKLQRAARKITRLFS